MLHRTLHADSFRQVVNHDSREALDGGGVLRAVSSSARSAQSLHVFFALCGIAVQCSVTLPVSIGAQRPRPGGWSPSTIAMQRIAKRCSMSGWSEKRPSNVRACV
eukprot:UN1692